MAKTYDKYKDSGIKWLGTIPANWRIEKGKHVLSVLSKPVLQDDDVVTCFRDGEVVLRNERRTEGFTMSDKEIGYQHIDKGDIVIHGMDGFAGSIGISKSTGKGSPVLVVCNPIKDNPSYLVYYLRILANTNVFLALSTGIRQRSCDLKWNKISVLPFPLPSLAEQRTITTFLDEKCGEIDSLISLQEEMISELQAYKQSVITEAVTKGLNPNTPMKDSGVEWIGILPKKWSNAKLKNIIDYIESGVSVNAGIENVTSTDIGVLKTSSVSKNTFIPTECKKVFETELSRVSCPVKGNTIIVSRMNTPELVGACGYVEKDYNNIFLPDRLWQVHFQETVHVKYIYYCLVSKRVKSYFSSLSSGTSSSMQNITQGQFQNTAITLPPLSEQQAIASYLDEKTTQIDSLIAIKQEKITELKDYKKSIIYEYVTGKKKV